MSCIGVGKIVTDAQMKCQTGCNKPFGTVRYCGAKADQVGRAYIVTRFGVEDLPNMPYFDCITDTHFFLIDANLNRGGPTVIQRQLAPANRPEILLFYRRGTGHGFQYLGPIQLEGTEVHQGHTFYKFKRLCPAKLMHSHHTAPGDRTGYGTQLGTPS